MPFQFTRTAIADVIVIDPKVIPDQRGFFMETYKRSDFTAVGITDVFVQCNHSKSAKGILRGLHYQKQPKAQGKLIRVLKGSIFDVAVDVRRDSPDYRRYIGVELSASEGNQLWIPCGFAHGFCTLEAETEVLYKVTAYYAPSADRSIVWNDPELNIAWPVDASAASLSDKDRAAPTLAQFEGRS